MEGVGWGWGGRRACGAAQCVSADVFPPSHAHSLFFSQARTATTVLGPGRPACRTRPATGFSRPGCRRVAAPPNRTRRAGRGPAAGPRRGGVIGRGRWGWRRGPWRGPPACSRCPPYRPAQARPRVSLRVTFDPSQPPSQLPSQPPTQARVNRWWAGLRVHVQAEASAAPRRPQLTLPGPGVGVAAGRHLVVLGVGGHVEVAVPAQVHQDHLPPPAPPPPRARVSGDPPRQHSRRSRA